jgi:hypothetical protein
MEHAHRRPSRFDFNERHDAFDRLGEILALHGHGCDRTMLS